MKIITNFSRLTIGMGDEELTAQQTALYDRQIRVWGVDAQKRLSKARILVCGLNGATIEFCKNIVLAGIGSLTIMDDRLVTEETLQANFLIPPDENIYGSRSLAELCCQSLKDFNLMVQVVAEKGDLSQFEMNFFDKFDAVVLSSCSHITKKEINNKCRKRGKHIAFYAMECRDSCGEIFVDLQNYTYTKKKNEEAIEHQLNYPSYEEAVSVPWGRIPRKVCKLYFAYRVIERFESSKNRNPGELSSSDIPDVLKLKKELCDAEGVNESQIPNVLLERLVEAGTCVHPPVCAILGGILGQEVIKAISGKGDPLRNFFYFDAYDGKGIIEDILSPTN